MSSSVVKDAREQQSVAEILKEYIESHPDATRQDIIALMQENPENNERNNDASPEIRWVNIKQLLHRKQEVGVNRHYKICHVYGVLSDQTVNLPNITLEKSSMV